MIDPELFQLYSLMLLHKGKITRQQKHGNVYYFTIEYLRSAPPCNVLSCNYCDMDTDPQKEIMYIVLKPKDYK